eukprot:3913975-Prymnesium_polylepis.1
MAGEAVSARWEKAHATALQAAHEKLQVWLRLSVTPPYAPRSAWHASGRSASGTPLHLSHDTCRMSRNGSATPLRVTRE